MGTSNSFNFIQIRREIEKELKALPKELAIILKDDSVANFNSQSFYGDSWESPKEDDGKKTLIDSGKLLSAVKNSASTGNKSGFDSFSLNIINSYGIFHNEGTNKLPKRQFIGESIKYDNKVKLYINKNLTQKFEIK